MAEISRQEYAASFGPTTGDRIRLADTNPFIEITEDRCVGGDEAVFGGGKPIRESMGQSRATRAEGTPPEAASRPACCVRAGRVRWPRDQRRC